MPPAPSKRPNIGNSGKRAKSAQSNPAQRFSQRNGGENLEESEGDLEAEDDDGAVSWCSSNNFFLFCLPQIEHTKKGQ